MTEKYMPYELVEEILKWTPTEIIYIIRTLCKIARICYNNRIKSATGLEIHFRGRNTQIQLYSADFSISKTFEWDENKPVDLNTLFPPSIIYLGLFNCDASLVYFALKHNLNIQELYFDTSAIILTFDLIRPLKKLVLIHFSECNNNLSLPDIDILGIYGFFPLCCIEGPIVFSQNNHHSGADTIDQLIKNEGYNSYRDSEKYCCKYWSMVPEHIPTRSLYTYELREKARFDYKNRHYLAHKPSELEALGEVLKYTKLPTPILQVNIIDPSFLSKTKKGRVKKDIAPPGILPRIYKY